jgi:polyhydroxyalkanoate synthesis repressor PhaR
MARVIKKYANRKLYDTTAKKYLTLDDIARLVQQGEQIQVIDNDTKQDVTSVVLSSIILDSAKKEASILPDTMLIGLIQKRGEVMVETVKKSVAAGVEAAEFVQQEMEKRIKEAIEKGREQADSVKAIAESLEFMFKDLRARMQKTVEETVENNLTRLLASMNIPTRQEIQKLEASVNQLSQQIGQLTKKMTAKSTPAKQSKRASGKARKR